MQPVERPATVALLVLRLLFALGVVCFLVGLGHEPLGLEEGPSRYFAIAGIVLSIGFGLWLLGTELVTRRVNDALRAMETGEILGSWRALVEGRQVPVELGARLAIVGGKLMTFAVHNQHVTALELDTLTPALRVYWVYNNGNGDFRHEHAVPFDPGDLEAVTRAGERLAERSGVKLTGTPV